MRFFGESEDIMDENLFRISDRPSRYQRGERLYIGGQIRYFLSGKEEQESHRCFLKSLSIPSTRMEIEEEADSGRRVSQMKLVRQATMQTLEITGRLRRASGKRASLPQDEIVARERSGQALWLTLVTKFRTFESPMIEKLRASGIFGTDRNRTKPEHVEELLDQECEELKKRERILHRYNALTC
jgi:hypothetical protein